MKARDNSSYVWSRITIQTSTKYRLDNYGATQSIQELMRKNDKHKIKQSTKNKVIHTALDIYNDITEERNHFVINTMLKLLYEFDKADKMHLLWNDIGILRKKHNRDISFPLLMKTCIKANNIDISQCIAMLEWMTESKYKLRLHGFFLNKLIEKCNHLDALQYVHSLITDQVIEDNNDKITKTMLIRAYSKCKSPQNAQKVFDGIDEKDCVLLGAMLSALIDNECYDQALEIYDQHVHLNNETTHILAIRASTKGNAKEKGLHIIQHKIDLKQCTDQHKNILIDFYAKYGDIERVLEICGILQKENLNIYTINGVMKAYLDNNQSDKVLELFDGITLQKDAVSYLLAIQSCNKLNDLEKGRKIHCEVDECGPINTEIKNALIDFYGNCADIKSAESLYHSMSDRDKDIVTVSAMMNAYCNNNFFYQSVELFNNLETMEHINADIMCHAIALKACCNGDLFDFGQEIFVKLSNDGRNKWMLNHIDLQLPFITLFGKSGVIEECQMIFDQIRKYQPYEYQKEIKIWNAMIKAYVKNGKLQKAKELYETMKRETELIGDVYTFSALLSGYSHAAKVDDAFDLWKNEMKDEGMRYDKIIMSSLIDSVCRKGDIAKGYELIEEFEEYGNNKPYHVMWMSLLNGSIINDGAMSSRIFDEFEERFGGNQEYMDAATRLMKKIL